MTGEERSSDSYAETINIRMGEMVITATPGTMLTAIGLGSCIGLAIVSPKQSIAGLAHVVLPDSEMALGHALPPGKFADTAVLTLISQMIEAGAHRTQLKAAVVGGAAMFSSRRSLGVASVGQRNAEAAIRWLESLAIPLVGSDVGGELGRTVQVYAEDGRILSRVSGQQPLELNPSGEVTHELSPTDVKIQQTA